MPQIKIGKVTSANPALWLDLGSLGPDPDNNRYEVSSAAPEPQEAWTYVNQFCTVLSTAWLERGGTPRRWVFEDLDDKVSAARTVIGYESMQSQVEYAAKALGGAQEDKSSVLKGFAGYPADTMLWFGNNVHVVAAVKRSSHADYYDSNDGRVAQMSHGEFEELLALPQMQFEAFVVKHP
jgi:hypothetical protein